ncbi:hypothetical protein B0H67DRAFT_554475 [Lasiosphaeris hirsuta]|uniref:Uncharacterized protein n=1 Tax=Lasiosphaeris hirsuta TaxID=260670 RepID=A0AA40AHT9_9PEZI|nr:hypothetical protein B0H67DRAFT_554475 [Lasiosphaeris hirsuta]
MRYPVLISLALASSRTLAAQVQRAHSAEITCYAPDGVTVAPNDTVVPCNNLGITQSGVHSSCCQLLGDESDRDLCAITGLCLTNGIVRRGFCTDPTWKSPACVKVCDDPMAGGSRNSFAEMTSCTDGTYCCGRNNLTCCGTTWAVKPPTLLMNTTITTTPSSTKTNIAPIAGLGGALGAVVLGAAGAILYLLRRIKTLQKTQPPKDNQPLLTARPGSGSGEPLRSLSRTPGTAGSSPGTTPSHMASPASGGNPDMEFATLKAMYDNALQQQQQVHMGRQYPRRSPSPGAHFSYLYRASELDGTATAVAPARPPKTPSIYEAPAHSVESPRMGSPRMGSPRMGSPGMGQARQGHLDPGQQPGRYQHLEPGPSPGQQGGRRYGGSMY